jgi:hypothetical protein
MTFTEAAEIGTRKVISEHSTIAVLVTTDGSISGISRANYEKAEAQVVEELKQAGKPFVILLNSTSPESEGVRNLAKSLEDRYGVSVLCYDVSKLGGAEIENIVEFLKNGKKYEYNADIIESIEREAAKCGEKKKGKGGMSDSDDFEGGEDRASIIASDDAVLPAIEIAVDSGSVSTSLLQRKLSLGYARAARIVDKLEKIGVVGPFEGSKPRKVLITREEYLEMRMTYEGTDE